MGLGLSKVALLIRKEQMIEALTVLNLGKQSRLGYRFAWSRKWQPTAVFLPGESMDRGAWRATVHGVAKSQT